jgi:hypothetical protein
MLNRNEPEAIIKSIDINIVKVEMSELFKSPVGCIIPIYAPLKFNDPFFCCEVSELIAYVILILYILLLVGVWDVAVHGLLRCLFLIAVSVKESSPSSWIRPCAVCSVLMKGVFVPPS